MMTLPPDLQSALAAGDAVLWTGAGLGALVGAPNWSDLLGALVDIGHSDAKAGLEDLLAQGRLQPVLTYIYRHAGDAQLEDLMRASIIDSLASTPAESGVLGRVPWRACVASVYPELLHKVLSLGGVRADIVRPREAHELTLRGERSPFVLAAPLATKSARADQVFFDFVEEIVHTRTIVLVGIDVDDPDLQQVLGLLERVGRGRRHYAFLPVISEPEAEEMLERHNVEVVGAGASLPAVFEALAAAATQGDSGATKSGAAGIALDLKRSLRGVSIRADFALDHVLTLDPEQLRELADEADRVKTHIPPKVALQLGAACFAHGDNARARKLINHVLTRGVGPELAALSRFNLALIAADEGDAEIAVESLSTAAEQQRVLALVPPRFSLEGVTGRRGGRWDLVCRDRTNGQLVHLELSTLNHLSSHAAYGRFVAGAKKLANFSHPHMRHVAGGFADGQVFGLICEAIEGRSFEDVVNSRGRLSLETAFRILGPIMDVIERAHAEGLVHALLHPEDIWVTADGPRLRGWGLAPVAHYRRPSIQAAQVGYAAPELLAGGSPTPSSDVFALGALLYRALTGLICQGAVLPPCQLVPELDPRIDGLLLACLHPDPAQRPKPDDIRQQIATIRTTPRPASAPLPQARAVPEAQREVGHDSGAGIGVPAPPPSFGDTAVDVEKPKTLRIKVGEDGPLGVRLPPPGTPPTPRDGLPALDEVAIAQAGAEAPAASEDAATSEVTPEPPADAGAPQVVEDRPSGIVRLELPEDPDDLEGWTWVLEQKPGHMEARTNLVRIEAASREAQRWDRVADCLRVRAELSQVQDERLAILRELAELLEGPLGAPAFALETLLSLIAEVSLPAKVSLSGDLLRLGRVTGRWQQVTAVLAPICDTAPEPADRANLARALARAYAEELGAFDRAHGMYMRALELEPELVSLHDEAAEFYRRNQKWVELAPVLLGLAELESGERRLELLVEAARLLAEALEEPEAALETVETARAEDPQFAPARELVTELARELERHDVMTQVLADEAQYADTESGAAAAYAELGTLRLEHFDDRKGAVEAWTEALSREPDRKDLRTQRLEAQRKRVEAHELPAIDLAEMVLADAEYTDELETRLSLWEEAARLFDAIDGMSSRATDCRERVLASIEPTDARAHAVVGALERAYAARQDAESLRQLYEARAENEDLDAPSRIQAWTGLHALSTGPAPDASLARRALESLVELEPGQPRWRDALIERYLSDGDREAAAKLVEARAAAAGDAGGRIEALIDLASLQLADGNLEGSEAKLREALEIEPGHARVWERLAEVQRRAGNADAAVQSQIRAAEAGESADAFLQAARGAKSVLNDRDKALALLERAYALEHSNAEIVAALLEARVDVGDLERAAPLAYARVEHLEKLEATGQGDRMALISASALAGRCALRVGDREGARKHLARARKLDASNFEVARLLADLQLESGQFEDALNAYQSVVLGASDLDDAGRAEIYVKMARCHREQARESKAALMLQRALEISPKHEGAIRSLVEVAGDLSNRVDAQMRLISLIDAGHAAPRGPDEPSLHEEALELRQSAANTLSSELARPAEAAKLVEEGLEKHGEEPALLHLLLDLRTKAEEWHAACAVCKRLSALQEDASATAMYLYAGAVLLRDNVGNKDEALDMMREVLEADPMHEKAYRSSREMLEAKKDHKELSRLIRGRLKALPEQANEQRAELFDALGALYEVELGDPQTALAAFEQAIVQGRRGEVEAQNKRVRHAYELALSMGTDAADKAIELAQTLIARRPMDFDAYHQLFHLFVTNGPRDGAVCVARALRFLKQANANEQEVAAAADSQRQVPRGTLTAEMWTTGLLHSEHDPRLSELFSIIWAVLAVRGGQGHAHLGLNRADKQMPTIQSTGISKHLAHAASVLDLAPPELFLRKDQPGGVKVGALVDGQAVVPTALAFADAVNTSDEANLAFRAGRAMARLSPANLPAVIVANPQGLRDVVFGAWLSVDPNAAVPPESRPAAANVAETLGRLLPDTHKDHLRGAMGRVAEAGFEPARWMRGVEFTCTRAGLLMADSLDAAARTISVGTGELGGVPATDLVKDLVSYSVSAPYLRLRKALKQAR